jgi:hypothetical protein
MEMSSRRWRQTCIHVAMISLLAPIAANAQTTISGVDAQVLPVGFTWATVANSGTVIPGGDGLIQFNSFNQPSVNGSGLVALRARSKGGDGKPLRGIYSRQMGGNASPLTVVLDTLTTVPGPNNIEYDDQLGTLTEFPAFPRIGRANNTIATRGQSKPVWEYQIGTDPTTGEPITTRTGTSGIYAMRLGERVGAMAQLGAVPGFDHYAVPGAPAGTKFDQFPGSPAVANMNAVVFKGNYTDGVSKTGIFFRSFNPSGMSAKTQVIASSNTVIPGQPANGPRFGSTAPPSAADTDAVFLGLDNEEAPTLGGIYRAPLATNPPLQTLVSIGGQVPGEQSGVTFNRLGEGLSYDGRFVAFWGAWGSETRSVILKCPEDGQKDVIEFCNLNYPNGHAVAIPVNQGFFVHDAQTRKTYPAVKTGGEYLDFQYWVFSGRPPGVGHSDSDSEDFEEPRWRSAAFAATHGQGGKAQVAFKGRKQTTPIVDGIYLTQVPSSPSIIRTVVEAGMDGAMLDPMAAGVPLIAVGIERDGLRNGWLAIAASMANDETGWAGVYVTRTIK